MDEIGAYYTELSKLERKTPIQYINVYIYIYGIERDGNDDPISKTAKGAQI